MVAVKVMAAETGFPTRLTDQRGMWNVHWIVFQYCVLMTVLTHARGNTHPDPKVLAVTADAGLHTHGAACRGKFGFQKFRYRMAIVGIFVARQALFFTCGREDKVRA